MGLQHCQISSEQLYGQSQARSQNTRILQADQGWPSGLGHAFASRDLQQPGRGQLGRGLADQQEVFRQLPGDHLVHVPGPTPDTPSRL